MSETPHILSAPSSNPIGAFSQYQITIAAPQEVAGSDCVILYHLVGIYAEKSDEHGAGEMCVITSSHDREKLKELLVAINGPIPEEADED
jgi:hypothetical protein